MSENQKIVLFDGVCNLCNSSVIRIIKHDKKNLFKFAALQESAGTALVEKYRIDTAKIDSIVLIENDRYFVKSSAILRIARHLSGIYPLAYAGIILPAFFRNWIYDIVARNRYKWYGKKDSCMIPTPELREKFL